MWKVNVLDANFRIGYARLAAAMLFQQSGVCILNRYKSATGATARGEARRRRHAGANRASWPPSDQP
ncbi:hypothetical protein GCM10010170_025410 [Dactylosporangium salmoneum]|uniref:Uncharacterized protein n=1 Tax=Dactylosporangium salmoneum TaxID=53361 RepID=A0ABP5SYJ7_9ACTN